MGWISKSILWKIVLPIPIAAIFVVVLMAFVVPNMLKDNAIDNAVDSATQTVGQFKTIRGYYTKNVIKKVLANGGVHPSFNHKNEEDGIPLPATFIHDMSDLLAKNDRKIKLYSAYPFPNRADRKLDDFQKEAWAAIRKEPDLKFVRTEQQDGQTVVRVAIADKMVAQGCVNCHNTRADTPKDDWTLNEVRGVLEVSANIENVLARGSSLSQTLIIGGILISLALCGVAILSARSVAQPITRMTEVMNEFAGGKSDIKVPSLEREDEIGLMARAMEVFRKNRAQSLLKADEQEFEKEQRTAQRRDETEGMATEFESSVGSIASSLEGFTQSLRGSADIMKGVSDRAQDEAGQVANMADQATHNAQTVAAAAEELSASIGSITQQVGHATEVATGARDQVDHTNEKIRELVEAVSKIGEVVQLITSIAEQTNLLALNATIESARAGEAGKGFAVVANEVKNLANQTARATQDIVEQIDNIQSATDDSVIAMEGVAGVIGEINEISAAIAISVEEQGAATQEISVNAQEAASGTGQVSATITNVNEAAIEVGDASEQLMSSVNELNELSTTLSGEVGVFLKHIRT